MDKVENFRLQGRRVMIQPIAVKERKTDGGIIIPDSVRTDNIKGIAVRIGNEVDDLLKVDEKVLIEPQYFAPIEIEGVAYLIGPVEGIAAIIDEKK